MSEEIKADHFKTMEDLLKHLKMWEEDDDYDAYYRFFCPRCAYEMAHKIEKQNELLSKKDKVIDCLIQEIIRMIYYYENYHNCEFDYDISEKISKTQKNIKEYFYKKVEEENESNKS